MSEGDGGFVASFFVPGRARTKGSMKPQVSRGQEGKIRVRLKESNAQSEAWKRTMILGIWEQCGITPVRRGGTERGKIIGFDPAPYEGPIYVDGLFLFQRERSVAKTAPDGTIWESHDTPYPTAGDIGDEDKLRRNLLDALTQSGLIKDDRFVIGPADADLNGKRWIDNLTFHPSPGVLCRVVAA